MNEFTFEAVYSVVPKVKRDALEAFVRYQGGSGLATTAGCVHTSIVKLERADKRRLALCRVRFDLPEFDGHFSTVLSYLTGMLPLFPGIVLRHVELSTRLLRSLRPRGPATGKNGIYSLVGVEKANTLFGAILKPPQLTPAVLARRVKILLDAGVDVIKEDDLALGAASHVCARLDRLLPVLQRGIDKRGRGALLLVYANGSSDSLLRVGQRAAQFGSNVGIMVAPGLVGFDSVARLRKEFPKVPIAIHTASMPEGIQMPVYLGLFGWLAGGDVLVLPVPGHFNIPFAAADLQQFNRAKLSTECALADALVSFGGGITPETAANIRKTIPQSCLVLCGSWAVGADDGIRSAFERIKASIGR